jgi:hypothetical protein
MIMYHTNTTIPCINCSRKLNISIRTLALYFLSRTKKHLIIYRQEHRKYDIVFNSQYTQHNIEHENLGIDISTVLACSTIRSIVLVDVVDDDDDDDDKMARQEFFENTIASFATQHSSSLFFLLVLLHDKRCTIRITN